MRHFPNMQNTRGLIHFLKTKLLVRKFRNSNATVGSVFREVVQRHPDKTAIICDYGNWSFRQLDEFSNQIANFFISRGFEKGDDISLMMEGRPEYIGLWLGASKAGVVTAFINTNLKQNSLLHSMTVVDSKALIFTAGMAEQVKEILPELLKKKPGIQLFLFNSSTSENNTTINNNTNNNLLNNNNDIASHHCASINEIISQNCANCCKTIDGQVLQDQSKDFPVEKMRASFSDKLFYVYTSGTTGLPKAAIIRHARYMFLGTGANNLVKLKGENVIYVPIPLYHMAGGAIGTCQLLLFGNTLAIPTKFSASKFWTDCIRWNCTASQYIGEICRYLLVQPERESDRTHNVKVMFGNGLRPNIWKEFKTRFNIKLIVEFYGSTEGNANVVNYTGKEGACGFVCQILPRFVVNFIYPVS